MNRIGLFALLALLMFPVLGFAQNQVDSLGCDTCVRQLSAQCPNKEGEGWTVNSVVAVGDTVVVEIETPASLNPFMTALAANKLNAKKLWVYYVADYGKEWKNLINRIQEERRSFCWRSNLKAAKKLIICLCHPTNLAQFLQNTDSAEVNLVYCVTKLIR